MALFNIQFPSLDTFDPFNMDSVLFGRTNGGNYVRDVAAMANVQVDWKETDTAHVFKANLPGLSREDVKVTMEEGRILQISGERKTEEGSEVDRWYCLERPSGGFRRRFRLPENTKVEDMKAFMDNGVLTITIPKIPKPAPKPIPIAG